MKISSTSFFFVKLKKIKDPIFPSLLSLLPACLAGSSHKPMVSLCPAKKVGIQELIRYMYTGRLREPIDAEATITLLCLADCFAISSCMEPLAKVLKQFPTTLNDCLLLLGLSESLKSDRAVQLVVEHCRTYLA